MEDERVIKLLEEIRDLQRAHVENYTEAVRNQKESIEMNRAWQQRASRRQLFLAILVVAMVLVLLWPLVRR